MREKEYKYIQTCTHITYTYIIICANFICRHFSLFLFAESSDSEAGKKKAREMAGREMSQGGGSRQEAKEAMADECGEYFNKTASCRYACNIRTNTRTRTYPHTDTYPARTHTLLKAKKAIELR